MTDFPADATITINSTTYSLASRRPDRGFSYDIRYNTNIFTSQSGHEKRQLLTRRPKRSFTLTYTNISGAYKQAIENFYKNQNGEAIAFNFDLTYVGITGSMLARFDGTIRVTQVLSTLNEETDFYNLSFNIVETYS